MSTLAGRPFLKMNGLGNEIVVLDLRGTSLRVQPGGGARDRPRRGLALRPADGPARSARAGGTDAFMRIYNTDGSESGACGNGTRCVAWALLRDGDAAPPAPAQTKAGLLPVTREQGRSTFTVDMGAPRLAWDEIPLARALRRHARHRAADRTHRRARPAHASAVVNMGNPHAVFWVEDVEALRPRPDRAAARKSPDLPRARQHLARPRRGARPHRADRCGSAAPA